MTDKKDDIKRRAIVMVALLVLACNPAPRTPEPITRIVTLGQTDGRRCSDGLPLLVQRSLGNYLFVLEYGGFGSLRTATITLDDREESPTTTIWSHDGVARDDEDGTFSVVVPSEYMTHRRYQFTLRNGKDEHLGRFAFTLVDDEKAETETFSGGDHPCRG